MLASDAVLRPLARLPAGHYHRTHMAVGPDGSVFVSSGFQIRQIFRVSPAGVVTVVARDLGDPEAASRVDDARRLSTSPRRLDRSSSGVIRRVRAPGVAIEAPQPSSIAAVRPRT